MNMARKLVVLMPFLLVSIIEAEEMVEFDVPAGKQEGLFEGQLNKGFTLTCRFAIDRKNTNVRQEPWISIRFYAGAPNEGGWADVEWVALSVYRQGSSEFFGEPIRWHYILFVGGPNKRDSSEEIATASGRDSVHTMTLALLNEKKVLALVGDQTEDASIVDTSPFALENWQVVVSGLGGRAFCADNTQAQDSS